MDPKAKSLSEKISALEGGFDSFHRQIQDLQNDVESLQCKSEKALTCTCAGKVEGIESSLNDIKSMLQPFAKLSAQLITVQVLTANNAARIHNCDSARNGVLPFLSIAKNVAGRGKGLQGIEKPLFVPDMDIGSTPPAHFPYSRREISHLKDTQIDYLSRFYNNTFGITEKDNTTVMRSKFREYIMSIREH